MMLEPDLSRQRFDDPPQQIDGIKIGHPFVDEICIRRNEIESDPDSTPLETPGHSLAQKLAIDDGIVEYAGNDRVIEFVIEFLIKYIDARKLRVFVHLARIVDELLDDIDAVIPDHRAGPAALERVIERAQPAAEIQNTDRRRIVAPYFGELLVTNALPFLRLEHDRRTRSVVGPGFLVERFHFVGRS